MNRRFAWLFVFAVLLSQPMVAQDEEQSARKLITDQRFAEARALYEQLLERDPGNVDYQMEIARISAWMKEYAKSIEIFDRVLAGDPRNVEALTGKAYAQMWQHHYSEAADLLMQAEKLSPDDPEVQVALARLYHYQGRERDAKERVSRALKLDPNDAEAKDLRGEIDPPRPVELHFGFNQDRFSFTEPGNMGFVSAGYIGETNQVTLQYEEWSLFDARARRAGLNFTRKLNRGWWLRAGAIIGPGAVVVPRQEYTGGVSHALPKRFAMDMDYRLLRFRAADVSVFSPALTYYLAKPAWITATFFDNVTQWRTGTAGLLVNQGWAAQYYHQVAKPVQLHAGYARGSEDFELLTVDRLGVFQANTYLAGAELRLSRACSAEFFGAYQVRSDSQHVTSFGVNFTVRQ